ncbi:DNA-packaging protein [Xenorhabdus kozodoii]|uniref:DNA-packaging protein n=1 Tax=Xenorhabdus kozodoii TaxID=351676 RepID=A0A2D0L0U2_9GAMM|nr:DNA-packaging protein [Xenorhabdus kozodoii]
MKAFSYQGEVTQEPVAKMRAMTLSGLCLFLDIADSTWQLYRAREDFMVVTIYQQTFTVSVIKLQAVFLR